MVEQAHRERGFARATPRLAGSGTLLATAKGASRPTVRCREPACRPYPKEIPYSRICSRFVKEHQDQGGSRAAVAGLAMVLSPPEHSREVQLFCGVVTQEEDRWDKHHAWRLTRVVDRC